MQNKEPEELTAYQTSQVPKTFLVFSSIVMITLGVLIAVTGWYIFPVMPGMACDYTARAETVVGSLLILVGGLLLFTKTLEARRLSGIVGIGLGLATILLPTYITGMCDMANPGTEPMWIILGAVAIIVSVASLVKNLPKPAKK